MIDSLMLGARVAAHDVMEHVRRQADARGKLDAAELKDWLLDYWINAGGLDEPADEDTDHDPEDS